MSSTSGPSIYARLPGSRLATSYETVASELAGEGAQSHTYAALGPVWFTLNLHRNPIYRSQSASDCLLSDELGKL